jgi:arylsulfatase B
MTGRYQQRFGYEFNGSDKKGGVSLNEILLPRVMKEAGYATGMVGKWHLGPSGPYYPTARGYDFFYGMSGGGTNYITDPKPGDEFGSIGTDDEIEDIPGAKRPGTGKGAHFTTDLVMLKQELEAVRTKASITHNGVLVHEEEYLTDALTREALNFIDQNRDHPFFLYVAQHAPHTPLQVTKKYYDRFPDIADKNTRIHAAMISALDDGVGAIEAKLKADGLDRNTVVFFLSDNGCPSQLHGACSNAPLAGFKRWHLEGGVRIPFIVSWPGQVPAGRVDNRVVSSLDIFPTAVAAARAKLPTDRTYDGVDLIPFLTGKRQDTPNPVLYWRAGPTFAIRDGNWKMISMNNAPPGVAAGDGAKIRKDKIGRDKSATKDKTANEVAEDNNANNNSARNAGSDPTMKPPYPALFGQHTMLYDLKTSPVETLNLAPQEPDMVSRLKAELADWNKLLVPPQTPSKTQAYDRYDGVMLQFYD